jgi:hypothetical protein
LIPFTSFTGLISLILNSYTPGGQSFGVQCLNSSSTLKQEGSSNYHREVILSKFTYHVTVGKEARKAGIKVAVDGTKPANGQFTFNAVL